MKRMSFIRCKPFRIRKWWNMLSLRSAFALLITLGLLSFIVSSCDLTSPPSSSTAIQVSPTKTSPDTLNVKMTIDEDQNASDGKSQLTLQFSSGEIKNQNYVKFTEKEKVTCNGASLAFVDPAYTARVGISGHSYTCQYFWNGNSIAFGVSARTDLSPVFVLVTADHKFTMNYNPDPGNDCHVEVDAVDGSQTISGPSELENGNGVYSGSDISSLNGPGTLVMTRTCESRPDSNFNALQVTYKSIAKIDVTWYPPAAKSS